MTNSYCDPYRKFRRQALRVLTAIGFVSLFTNLLTLSVPLYMIQLFDRVLISRSEPSLFYLTLAAIGALLAFAVLDWLRARILSRIGQAMEKNLGPELLERSLDAHVEGQRSHAQPLRDIAQVRQFFSGTTIVPLFDAPWVPVYLGVTFLLHPVLGSIAIGGAAMLLINALVNEFLTRQPLQAANKRWSDGMRVAEEAVRNAGVVDAMGLGENIVHRWQATNAEFLRLHNAGTARNTAFTAASKLMRLSLQILILGAGAYLVIHAELTTGAMIAGSILLARGLQPVEQVIGAWKSLVGARQAHRALREFLAKPRSRKVAIELPDPRGHLSVTGVSAGVLEDLSFNLEAGETLAVMGPSGAGKSTLARLLVGSLEPTHGEARLDGADVFHWNREHFGAHVGYLPQGVELFDDASAAENIARMAPVDQEQRGSPAYSRNVSNQITGAATLAHAHEMILGLPDGYWTPTRKLSGGQRQRVALARALFGEPTLVVLDEPDSNLDVEGKKALYQALRVLKDQKCTVVIVSHEVPLLSLADKILVLWDGAMRNFGPPSQVLGKPVQGVLREARRGRGSH
jgi:PrtD family type I secretion system ABC transporter